jgi:hypothetical protein
VRKSRARLEYVGANGWEDLSDGGDGKVVEVLSIYQYEDTYVVVV